MDADELKAKMGRRASRAIAASSPSSEAPLPSWFGKVLAALPGETWPESQGKPMTPLGQFNLTELPYRPENLSDIAIITVFISQIDLPSRHEPNGDKWLLRAYPTLEGLIAIEEPPRRDSLKPFPIRWDRIDADYPTWDDIDSEKISTDLTENYYDNIEIQWGTKFGGWPTCIQGAAEWAPMNIHPFHPEFAFQIDSEEEAGWMWGDAGVGYFGRGTGAHRDKWMLTWQCY